MGTARGAVQESHHLSPPTGVCTVRCESVDAVRSIFTTVPARCLGKGESADKPRAWRISTSKLPPFLVFEEMIAVLFRNRALTDVPHAHAGMVLRIVLRGSSLGSYLQDENMGEASEAAAGADQHKSGGGGGGGVHGRDSPPKGGGAERSARSAAGGGAHGAHGAHGPMCSPREKRHKTSSSPPRKESAHAKDPAGATSSKDIGKDANLKEASEQKQKEALKDPSTSRASGTKGPVNSVKEAAKEAEVASVDPLAAAAAALAAAITRAGDGPASGLRSAGAGGEVNGTGSTGGGQQDHEKEEGSGDKGSEKDAGAATRATRSSARTSARDPPKSPEKKTGVKRQR